MGTRHLGGLRRAQALTNGHGYDRGRDDEDRKVEVGERSEFLPGIDHLHAGRTVQEEARPLLIIPDREGAATVSSV